MAERYLNTPLALPSQYGRRDLDGRDSVYLPDVAMQSIGGMLSPARVAPRLMVVGVGGAGTNVLKQMPQDGTVRRLAVNTDAQTLPHALADDRVCLGEQLTRGHGTGGQPEVGAAAAEASRQHLLSLLRGVDLVFITAGLGGGTGTGAAPVIARLARECGALTIGLASLPFSFEGNHRRHIAEAGLATLEQAVDALFVIPNDRLLRSGTHQNQYLGATFAEADALLGRSVAGIVEIVTTPGLINVDFADVRTLLHHAGRSLLAVGEGSGPDRVRHAVESALEGAWLESTLRGARRVLLNITASPDLTLFEVTETAAMIGRRGTESIECVLGVVIDAALKDQLRLTVIAAGHTDAQ